jgi:hypothetical protein
VVGCLLCKYKALSSNTNHTKKEKEKSENSLSTDSETKKNLLPVYLISDNIFLTKYY